MKFHFLLFIFAFSFVTCRISAQSAPIPWGKYWIELNDKADTGFSTKRPAEFLSPRALQRRQRDNVAISENDLPVSQSYIDAIREKGVQIHGASKWLNAVAIAADSGDIEQLELLPFVTHISYIGRHGRIRNVPNQETPPRPGIDSIPITDLGNSIDGYTATQNQILGLPLLHRMGHRGAGIMVAVMDGGFRNSEHLAFFDSVALDNRLIQGRDFVEGDDYVFEDATHGTAVLSVMAGNVPGYFMGGAPDATYVLLKTEDIGSEFPIEEVNWVLGAEYADSIGADIINASLGYTSFYDKKLSHTYKDLDGKTGIASRGAQVAVQKGMIVCNSAGNSGGDDWRYVGIPADAPGLIAVGAVNYNRKRSYFSSFGPTPDGRIKPDLAAPGERVLTAGNRGLDIGMSNGTSLASPMLTGAFAALWSENPKRSSQEILDIVFKNSNQSDAPNNALGWGIPDFFEAYFDMVGLPKQLSNYYRGTSANDVASNEILLFIPSRSVDLNSFEVFDVLGKKLNQIAVQTRGADFQLIRISGLNTRKGFFYGHFQSERGLERFIFGKG